MTFENINKIEELKEFYLSQDKKINSFNYEIQLFNGLIDTLEWSTLSDPEKLEKRKKDFRIKSAYKELYPDIVVIYEGAVIELTELIMKFLNDVSPKVFDMQKMSNEEFAFFRLKNMLSFELYIIHSKIKLQHSGHVLYDEIMEPIFKEIENTVYDEQYQLKPLKQKFKEVCDLFLERPYEKL